MTGLKLLFSVGNGEGGFYNAVGATTHTSLCTRYRRPIKGQKVKGCIAFYGNPNWSYRASPAIWDHTVLLAAWHRRPRPTINPARQAGAQFTYQVEG